MLRNLSKGLNGNLFFFCCHGNEDISILVYFAKNEHKLTDVKNPMIERSSNKFLFKVFKLFLNFLFYGQVIHSSIVPQSHVCLIPTVLMHIKISLFAFRLKF